MPFFSYDREFLFKIYYLWGTWARKQLFLPETDFEMAASAFAYFHSGGNFPSAVLGKPGHCG